MVRATVMLLVLSEALDINDVGQPIGCSNAVPRILGLGA
jgi:hypothetical protein